MAIARITLWVLASATIAAAAASGQDYPHKPIRMVTSAYGGGSDFAARVITPGLARGLGQQVIVDNRGSSFVPGEIVSRAPPDGYTLIYYGSLLWLLPLLQDNVPFDTLRDFTPIALMVSAPNILVVHPSVPAKSTRELIALAKAKPGTLNYASGGVGSSFHLAGELFKAMAGVDIVRIPFKGSGPAITAMLIGETQFMFPSAGGAASHVKAGKLRALAVTSAEPSALLPELPTMSASGLPGYESVQMSGILAPAKTPVAIIQRLNREAVRVVQTPEVRERYLNSGVDPIGSTPEEFGAKIKSEVARMGKVIKDAGIRAE